MNQARLADCLGEGKEVSLSGASLVGMKNATSPCLSPALLLYSFRSLKEWDCPWLN
jgi:hypothetical protein